MTAIDAKWAWSEYKPSPDNPWTLRQVGHLYRRAAFGATYDELQAGLVDGPKKAIDKLLQGGPDGPAFPDSIKRGNVGAHLPAWWLKRLLETKHPLKEKLTLFWHNHFATSNAKVNNAGFMIGLYELMYKHSLGNYAELLRDISRDPAMLVWLDGATSPKAVPNENYAREIMELFSLGIGHYTEQDIRQAARAFTGWRVRDGKAVFESNEYDAGEKTVLGKSGKFRDTDIVKLCLDQEACPMFIAGKLYRYLVSESEPPAPELLKPLAEQFRAGGFDFGKLVATVLRSNLFFSDHAYRQRVKSPVDFAVGTVHALEGNVSALALAQSLEDLGQRLFYPPSVKGWDGGPAWLNGQTLLSRQNLMLALTSTEDDRYRRRCDPATVVRKYAKNGDTSAVGFLLTLLLQDDVPADTHGRLNDYLRAARSRKWPAYRPESERADQPIRAVCHLVLTLPEYQLD